MRLPHLIALSSGDQHRQAATIPNAFKHSPLAHCLFRPVAPMAD